jgi:hypothetical protein
MLTPMWPWIWLGAHMIGSVLWVVGYLRRKIMPFVSDAQRRWGNSPTGHEALGDAGVKEWNAATKGKALPEKVEKPKMGLQTLINKQKGR